MKRSILRRMDLRGAVAALALGGAMLASRNARAVVMADMPGVIQKAANMPCTPACTLCHMVPEGGSGTAQQPFVGDLFDVGFNRDSSVTDIQTAIDALKEQQVDGDGDGIPDIDELQQGLNPNDPNKGASLCGPVYGCVRVAKPGRVDGVASAASAAVLLLGMALLRRRRTGSAPRRSRR